MDTLQTIIQTLSEEDKKACIYFIQRQGRKSKRKDVALFRLLDSKQTLGSKRIQAKLYPEKTKPDAYHALRKRLMRNLTDFILLKRMGEDTSTVSVTMGMISLATYLFDQQADKLAWRYLQKAEKLATEHEQYDLLNNIYNLMIEYADREYAEDLMLTIEKHRQNKALADEDERASIANSVIKLKLREVRLKGIDLNFDQTIVEVLNQYQLTEAIKQRAKLFFNLMSIARSSVLARKDYFAFEPYIIEHYHQFEAQVGFAAQQQDYQLQLLYMMAHVTYRNKHFSQSVAYLDDLSAAFSPKSKGLYTRFYARHTLLLAANYTFLNRLDEAIGLLEDLLQKPAVPISTKDSLNAYFNLGIYYVLRQDYRQAVKCVHQIQHSDTWLSKKMGMEWVVRKNLSELLLQYELGNMDLVLQRLANVERKYADMIALKEYAKAKTYMYFLKKMASQTEQVRLPDLYDEIQTLFPFLPFEQEDIQEVFFYAWLKAKALGKAYYEVLLELIEQE